MSKYIIDVGDAYIRHGLERTLTIPVRINEHEDHWMDTRIPLTPYTEPDLEQVKEEAYEDGYKTAKVQCNIQAEKDLREVGERHYQKGLSDAWEAVRKIAFNKARGGFTYRELETIFGTDEMAEILDMSASEAIEKIRQYEQEQEEIKVGDEVIAPLGVAVITEITDECFHFIHADGSYGFDYKRDAPRKTGRHFPEIAAVLAKMKEES